MKHSFKKNILKAYDIRGEVGKDLFEEDLYFVGRAYGTWLNKHNKKTCVIGYDGRHSSPKFAEEAIKGLLESGIDIINIGLCPTPMVYFAVKHLKVNAGIIITASHNPPQDNGIKMLTDEDCVCGNDIQELGRIAESGIYSEGKGTLKELELKPEYINFVLKQFRPGKKTLNIVWDAGNGAMGAVLDDVVAKLPGKHKTLFSKVDGDFPNHHPDPSIEKNMLDLSKAVTEGKYDFGIAFDGDGDRIGVVDEKGFILYGDQTLLIFARDFLKTNPGEKVMSEVKASKVLYDDIEKHGGIPVMWKPGHAAQKQKMKLDNIKLAGETSGHMFFGENYNYDDAMYAAIKLITIMSNSDETISQIRESLPKTYSTKEIRVTVGDTRKFEIPTEIKERIIKTGGNFVDVDGLRVNLKEGWWLARASNTQPDLTTRCEALSPEDLEIVKNDLKTQLKASGVDINFD